MSENKKRVLHIEDDPDLQDYVAAIIGDKVDIINASSLKEGYDSLGSSKFDLILLDLTLPDGSGIDLLNSLSERVASIPPVVIFSAHDVTNTLPHVEEVLVKGRFNDENLLTIIIDLLKI